MALSIQQVPSPHNRPRPGGITHISMHWMAGRIAGADARFRANPQGGIAAPNGSSAHYGIAGTTIHQYVQESRRAGSDGNSASNDTTISIEHEGGWVENGAYVKPSPQTHETSAQLCADIARRHGWKSLRVGVNVFPHNHYVNTMCPGSLDINLIVNRANQLLSGQEEDDVPNIYRVVKSPTDPAVYLSLNYMTRRKFVDQQDLKDTAYLLGNPALLNVETVLNLNAFGVDISAPEIATVDTKAIAAAVVAGLPGLGAGADTAALAKAVEATLADNFAALPGQVRTAIIK